MRTRRAPRYLWSAPRMRHLARECVRRRSHPCVASFPASRRGVTSIAGRGLVTRIGTCGNRRASHVSGRMLGLDNPVGTVSPVGREPARAHSPRHGACADAQPPSPGVGNREVLASAGPMRSMTRRHALRGPGGWTAVSERPRWIGGHGRDPRGRSLTPNVAGATAIGSRRPRHPSGRGGSGDPPVRPH